MKRYTRLTLAEREEISRHVAVGVSVRAMARQLGRAPSTISRELHREAVYAGCVQIFLLLVGGPYESPVSRLGKFAARRKSLMLAESNFILAAARTVDSRLGIGPGSRQC